MNWLLRAVEVVIFNSRWLLAPFLLGMVVGLAAILYTFIVKLVELLMQLPVAAQDEVIVGVLKLVDLSLIANLIVIVIYSSYENFVAPIDPSKHPNWPGGLIGIGFSALKQKLLGSIVAIVAVNVLDWFLDIDRSADNLKLTWVVGILIAFAIAMLVLALADRLSGGNEKSSRNS
jgi:uncharacterized protein (TIGR00645 family)